LAPPVFLHFTVGAAADRLDRSLALLVGLLGSLVLMRRLGPQTGWRLTLASGSCLLLAAAGRWLVAISP
jgi:hypothetical protein